MQPGTFEIRVDSNVEDVTLLSSVVRSFLERLHLDAHESDMTELCLQEALVNCVVHAYGRQSGNIVLLRLILGRNEVVFEVEDRGPGVARERLESAIAKAHDFDPSNPSTLSNGGRGMLIIARVMDSWDYFQRDGANVLRMTKSFQAAA
ncbi:MAG: ATP-binding protein [Bryobacterales bacterium]|jgi:anti-sigma regulatory factor (Ser/Thr protein kinase)|nr:ATP-binding protein [Bryobacterales bacterium]